MSRRYVLCVDCEAGLIAHPDEPATAPRRCARCWHRWMDAGAQADPIAETAREIETREASAGPIAEVPFALHSEPATRRAVDGRLF